MATPEAPAETPEVISSGLEALRTYGREDDELYLESELSFEAASFGTASMATNEESVRMIKAVEKHVRGAREYKTYLSYLRGDLGMSRCSFLSRVDVSGEVGLEYHHCPMTLFDICQAVIDHRLARGQAVTSLSVADEVMQAHFDNLVGLVPLTVTVHKLVHAGAILVHPSQVHGDWLGFARRFPDGINGGHVEKLMAFASTTEEQVLAAAAKLQYVPGTGARPDALTPTRDEIETVLLGAS